MKNYILILFVFVFCSCDSKITKVNDAVDIKKAEQLTSVFYKLVSENKIDSIIPMLSINIAEDDFRKWIKVIKTIQGEIIKVDIKKTYTKSEQEKNRNSFYAEIEIEATYEKGKAKEILNFTGDSKIEISGYSSKIQ